MTETEQQPDAAVECSDLVGTRTIYELVDASDCETHWTMGVWLTLEEAIAEVEKHNDDPNKMTDQDHDESCTFEIRKRDIGWSENGKTAWKRQWVCDWNEDETDLLWRVVPTK